MIEQRILKVARTIYLGQLRLLLRCVNMRSKYNLAVLNTQLWVAQYIISTSVAIGKVGAAVNDRANLAYYRKDRAVAAAYCDTLNAIDDVEEV